MNITQVSSYFPPHLGGLENVAMEISKSLKKRGHKVEVFTSNIGCPKEKQLKSTKNLKIHYLPAKEFAHSPIIPSLYSYLMKIPKDSIIHLHAAQAYVPEIVWAISKIRKIPYIIHLHGNVEPSGKWGYLLPIYKKFFFKRVVEDANCVFVLTSFYEKFFKERYKLSKVIVVPNSVSKDFFLIKKVRKDNLINLLYVGRLAEEKNIPVLIKAVSSLNKKVVFNIVGEGEKENEIRSLIKELGLKNIILHGKKSGKDLIKMYKDADIFLLASNSEGLPLTLLEAMATETPIIGSDVKGIHELIEGIGILVKTIDYKNFSNAINDLILNKRLRKNLSRKAKDKVKKYSNDKIIEKIEKVYEEVLREHNKKLKQKKK